MDRRGFFSKLFDSVPNVFFLGVQVVFASNAQEKIWEELLTAIRNHQNTQSSGLKRAFYNDVVRKLLTNSFAFEYGYWDFIKKEKDANAEFDDWVADIEEAISTRDYEMTENEDDVNRLSVKKDYIAVTIVFLLSGTDRHEPIFKQLNNIQEYQFNDRSTYELLLNQVKSIDFENCMGDGIFIMPGNENDGLSWEDIHGEGWDYLAPIF